MRVGVVGCGARNFKASSISSEKAKEGAITESWGKCGIIRETDMCFMEDHNTGTFTSKKRKLEKEMKKGLKKVGHSELTVFNDYG